MTEKKSLQEQYDKLHQFRDEVKVQLNLGKMQVRDAWEDIEKDFHKVEAKMKDLRDRGEEEATKLRGETREMMGKIREKFDTLRKQA